jgi:hypothetical protein
VCVWVWCVGAWVRVGVGACVDAESAAEDKISPPPLVSGIVLQTDFSGFTGFTGFLPLDFVQYSRHPSA